MKKILKYSTIIGTAVMLAAGSYTVATADTGGYVRIKGFESHFKSLGFNQTGCAKGTDLSAGTSGLRCRFASETHDYVGHSTKDSASDAGEQISGGKFENELKWAEDDGEGVIAGADFGFFRLEVEATYQSGAAQSWRGRTATAGRVYQGRVFGNIVAEPFDLLELLGEYGGVDALVKYNPAHYGISPYAMYGYGVMGGVLENLAYTQTNTGPVSTSVPQESGAFAGGAMAAVNVGAGVNISLDKVARTFSELSGGASLPEYFKLPIEFSVGYHWQVGLDDMLSESVGEDLGIDDGGLTYSVGLKW